MAVVASTESGQRRYETLRSQALAASGWVGCESARCKVLQSQGLAAWLAHGLNRLADGDAAADLAPAQADWILALADLVLGDRREG